MEEVVGVEEERGVGSEVRLTTKQRDWLRHIERSESLGLSYAQYCNQEGLNVRRLYAAARTLRAKGCLAEVEASAKAPRLAAVRVTEAVISSAVVIELPHGVRLTWSAPDAGAVAALVQALSSPSR